MSLDKTNYLHKLFIQYASEIEGFLTNRYPKESDVGDIVQEIFLKLSQSTEPEAIQNPKAYLFQTAVNIAINRYHWRERRGYDDSENNFDSVPSLDQSPETDYQIHQQLDQFEAWLQKLPIMQRHAFVLYRIHGYSHSEIADKLGISVRSSQRYVVLTMQYIDHQLRNNDLDWR